MAIAGKDGAKGKAAKGRRGRNSGPPSRRRLILRLTLKATRLIAANTSAAPVALSAISGGSALADEISVNRAVVDDESKT